MKKRNTIAGILILAACMLTGCGDGALIWENVLAAPPDPVKVTAETVEEKQPERIDVLQQRYGTTDFTNEEYLELAKIYLTEFKNKDARDVLELNCRLTENPEGYELLQGITVNLAEENSEIKDMAGRLTQNLNAEELFGEALAMLYHEEWQQTMMPKMKSGKRKYYLETEAQVLYIQIGFDAFGSLQTTLWLTEGNEVDVIIQTAGTLQVVSGKISDGIYEGAFESWRFLLESTSVFHEFGSVVNGHFQGEYNAEVKIGKSVSDILTLWNHRNDFDMTVYSGEFDENGQTLLAQPEGLVDAEGIPQIIYAYAQDKKKYLSVNAEMVEQGFSYAVFGLPEYPSICSISTSQPE